MLPTHWQLCSWARSAVERSGRVCIHHVRWSTDLWGAGTWVGHGQGGTWAWVKGGGCYRVWVGLLSGYVSWCILHAASCFVTANTSRYMYDVALPWYFLGVTLDTYQDTSGYVYPGLFITIHQDTPRYKITIHVPISWSIMCMYLRVMIHCILNVS